MQRRDLQVGDRRTAHRKQRRQRRLHPGRLHTNTRPGRKPTNAHPHRLDRDHPGLRLRQPRPAHLRLLPDDLPNECQQISWTYDPVGNRLTETRATTNTGYTYDGDDRLTQTSVPGTNPYPAQVQTDGAQPYWRLDETSGSSFASKVGTYTGTWHGSPTLGVTGALTGDPGTAVTLASSSQYGTVANAAGLNKTNNFSLELWLKRSRSGALQAVVGKPLTTTTKSENYAIWLTTANKPQFEVGAGTGTKSAVITSSTAITDTTTWHHIVGTFASGVLKIYLDGTLTGTNSAAGFTTVTTNTSALNISLNNATNYYGGSLDEIAVYGTALTATQITDHHNKGVNTPPPAVTAYGYDNDGRQTTAGANTYAYNLANQLTAATVNGTASTYSYDGDNNRLTTTSGGTTTNQLWDTNYSLPQLALEQDASHNLLRRYLIGNDTNSLTTPAGNFFYQHDTLGSTSNITDATGNLQWTYAYEPYGAPTSQTVKNNVNAPTNPLQFNGQYADAASSLYNLRARQYDSTSGRFLSQDPANASIGSSYAYTDDRPSTFFDPSGSDSDPSGSQGCPGILSCFGTWFVHKELGWHAGCERSTSCLLHSEFDAALFVLPGGLEDKAGVGAVEEASGFARLVIGRTSDLTAPAALQPGEYTLLDRLTPSLSSPKANWIRNSTALRQELRSGVTQIRDASPGNTAGEFLNAERNLLTNRGWTFDPTTSTWNAP